MNIQAKFRSRRGALLPMVALCLIGLFALMALAIDVGMIAIARNQCQNAADASAMAGARTLNGNDKNNYNYSTVPGNAVGAASENQVLGAKVQKVAETMVPLNAYSYQSGPVKVEIGTYSYSYDDSNAANEKFKADFPRKDSTEPYSAVRTTVKSTNSYGFAKALGYGKFNVVSTSTAVHRPRDVIIIMDLSGSMRFQSLPGIWVSGGTASPSASNRPRNVSMNGESTFPQFNHYSDTTAAALKGNTSYTTGAEMVDPCNLSAKSNSGPAIAEDFYQNASGTSPGTGNLAFKRSSDSYDKTPAGDILLRTNANAVGNPLAHTVNDIINSSVANSVAFENYGYDAWASSAFAGYTEGPGYWGKTFFVWPPDPRGPKRDSSGVLIDANTAANHADNGAKDWRQRFFFKYNTGTAKLVWLDHTNLLFDPSGTPSTTSTAPTNTIMRLPSTTLAINENGVSVNYQYRINYAAILKWLKDSPVHFPSTLQAGRIRFYSKIPDYKDTALNNRWWTTPRPTDVSERFWKEYIDFMIGLCLTTSNAWDTRNRDPDGNDLSDIPNSALIGNGDYFKWGTTAIQIKQKPDITRFTTATVNASYSSGANVGYTSDINIKNVPTNPALQTGWFVRFSTHDQLYKLTSASSTVIRIDSLNSTSHGLKTSINTSTTAKFYNYQTGLVNNASGYAVGTGFSSDILVKGLAYAAIANNTYVRFESDPDSLYYVTATTTSSGQVTGFRINDGKGKGLRKAIANNDIIHFMPTRPDYMEYADNTYRPRHQLWFGPQSFIDYLGNYNTSRFWWPGNVHEAQSWACKVGIQTAIDDIKNNHPNDFIGMAFFSSPKYSASGGGQHNKAIVPLGRNYQQLKDSLWFPPTTVTGTAKEITPYDDDFDNVPRAKGGTGPQMGFMIAYNLFSSNITSLRNYSQPQPTYRGIAGGLGRKGATRLIIFETDGAPNTRAHAALSGSGASAYYPIRVKYPEKMTDTGNTEWPTGSGDTYVSSEVYTVVEQICKLESQSGFSTTRKKAQVFSLGYGSLFDPSSGSSDQTNALNFLQTVQFKGNTATTSSGSDFPDWQRIYGTNDQRITRMQTAFTKIMQSGVQVALIE